MNNYPSGIDNRINRLVGQIEGIRRMINAGRSAEDVTQQILAAREALSKVGLIVLKDSLVKNPAKNHKKVEKLLKSIFRI